MEQLKRRLGFIAKLLGTLTALSACKGRTSSDLQDVSAVKKHYWSEGDYYFRGECSEGQAPSRSCVTNLSSLSKNEIAGVQKRLDQAEDKELFKELGLESILSEADKLQDQYSSKIKLLSDLSNPTISRELVSMVEREFVDKLFRGRAAFLDIKSLSISAVLICIVTNNEVVFKLSPYGQAFEGEGRLAYAMSSDGCLKVLPNNGDNLSPSGWGHPETINFPGNIIEVFLGGLFCVTFFDMSDQLNLACNGSIQSEKGFKKSPDDLNIKKSIDYKMSRTLVRARSSLKVGVGYYHLCSVADETALFCEGVNYYGQLGTGDLENRGERVAVLRDVIDVTSGSFHTCAIQKGGALRCWGRNDKGQLGHIYPVVKATDEKAVVMYGVRKVVADGKNTCVILENKDLHCWGETQSKFVSGIITQENTPISKGERESFIHKDVLDVAVNSTHICTLIANQGLKCWGDNSRGQLGFKGENYGDQPGETLDKLQAVFKYKGPF